MADVFEALTSERSYRWGLPEETALESLMRGSAPRSMRWWSTRWTLSSRTR